MDAHKVNKGEIEISCPYCQATLTPPPIPKGSNSQRIICDECKQPIALYRTEAEALGHRERGVKPTSIEAAQFDTATPYLEIIETEFTKPQRIQLPEGKSLFGRYNPRSSAKLQVLTADPSWAGRETLE